jgi:hypothetical protein
MAQPTSLLHLPLELWFHILRSFDSDPIFLWRTCRSVNHTFRCIIEAHFRSFWIPQRTQFFYRTNLAIHGGFSHFSDDRTIAHFTVEPIHARAEMRLYHNGPTWLYVIMGARTNEHGARELRGVVCSLLNTTQLGLRDVRVETLNSARNGVEISMDYEVGIVRMNWRRLLDMLLVV